ncbi:MAG: hypothetical protein WBO58_05035 [Gammaproteobacteria bacterium]
MVSPSVGYMPSYTHPRGFWINSEPRVAIASIESTVGACNGYGNS